MLTDQEYEQHLSSTKQYIISLSILELHVTECLGNERAKHYRKVIRDIVERAEHRIYSERYSFYNCEIEDEEQTNQEQKELVYDKETTHRTQDWKSEAQSESPSPVLQGETI